MTFALPSPSRTGHQFNRFPGPTPVRTNHNPKSRIAEDLAISRFKVARLIDEAIEEGLVRFEIDEAGELDARLSDRLREKYLLRSALVLAGPDLPCSALIEPLGRVAASLLEEMLTDGCVLG